MARVFPRPLLRQQQKTKIERFLPQPPAFLPGAQFAIFHLFFFFVSREQKEDFVGRRTRMCIYGFVRKKEEGEEGGWMDAEKKKVFFLRLSRASDKRGKGDSLLYSSPLNSMPPWPQIAGPDMARERRGKSCARISVFFTMIQKKIFRFILLYQMVEKERPFEARPTDRFFFPMSAKLILHCLWLFAGLVWPEK